ncbi:winged helix-turn-helix domain-containing protein [Candidatus Bipolaricaulota bacterium]|nr:winged helix-turn-helix domain-containing protein [Candidatus Bipolaricaulota bacterium]
MGNLRLMQVALRGWRLGVAVGVVILTLAGVVTASVIHRRALEASFRTHGIAFAVAFADATEAWLATGDTEAIYRAAQLMFLGSVRYVQAVSRGVVCVDAQREGLPDEPLLVLDSIPRIPLARYVRSPGARHSVLDVAVPLLEGGPGYVRLGLDTQEIASGARAGTLLAVGAGFGLNLLVLGALFLAGRRRLARVDDGQGKGMPSPAAAPGLVVDGSRKAAALNGVPLSLSPKLFSLLALLVSEPGRVFSDREILGAVWPASRYANAKDVKQHIYLLRKKLRGVQPGAEGMIVTVPGFGYRFEPPRREGG